MTLPMPHYIRAADIQENTIKYRWDDWNEERVEGPIDGEMFTRLCEISQRANVALTIASGEWIIYRFGSLLDDPIPLQHIEAAWAQMIDYRYSFPWQFTKETWDGPIRGPVIRAMELVTEAINALEADDQPAFSSASICKLTEHVISKPMPYQTWRERVVQRLERLYPLDPEEKMGEVVPREALDPEFDFKPEDTKLLVNNFLSSLSHTDNILLHSPKEMLEAGFEGIPYLFNIEKDRKARFEW